MLSSLPPVRCPVPLGRGHPADRSAMERFFSGRRIDLYASGTAALARAVAECAASSSTKAPEVILPAYGCPDLVAACMHASVYPRLVDVARSGWGFDRDALRASLSPSTVAIVAVNLLGIGDDSAALLSHCREMRISLIQDSAQSLPRTVGAWPGDYIILSFGRGKPMNLLHGGALVGPPEWRTTLPRLPARYAGRARLLATRAAGVAFNTLTRPRPYWALSRLPGMGLGEVAYHELRNAAPVPERAWRQVGASFEAYRRRPVYSRAIWQSALDGWRAVGIAPLECAASPVNPEPLRLALLAPDRAARDALVSKFDEHGLGASRFYGCAVNALEGIPDSVRRQGPFPNAAVLAGKLFTLPTHCLVRPDTVRLACKVIADWHRSRGGS